MRVLNDSDLVISSSYSFYLARSSRKNQHFKTSLGRSSPPTYANMFYQPLPVASRYRFISRREDVISGSGPHIDEWTHQSMVVGITGSLHINTEGWPART